MTLEDVLEEIENSEEFFEFNPYLKKELNAKTANVRGEYTIRLKAANNRKMSIKYDGDKVNNLTVPTEFPGNDGDIYSYKDIPIITVESGGATIYSLREKHPDAYYTALGTYEDITSPVLHQKNYRKGKERKRTLEDDSCKVLNLAFYSVTYSESRIKYNLHPEK